MRKWMSTPGPEKEPAKIIIIEEGSIAHEILDKMAELHRFLIAARSECEKRKEKTDVKCINAFLFMIEENFGEYLETPPTPVNRGNQDN